MAKRMTDAELLKRKAKESKANKRGMVWRMWLSIFASKYFRDRGVIPPNIGNNIFIGNGMFTTKNYMSVTLLIQEFSDLVPLGFESQLLSFVRDKVKNATVDFTIKTKPYEPDMNSSGMKDRIKSWTNFLNSPLTPEILKKRSARCLYTVDLLKKGTPCFQTDIYVIIRSDNGRDLEAAVAAASKYIASTGTIFIEIRSDMMTHLKNMLIMSDQGSARLRDYNRCILSSRAFSELLPTLQGMNDKDGFMLGFDNVNNAPYLVDIKKSASSKNFAVLGPSGRGKTFLVLTWCFEGFIKNYRILIRDLKGNEFDILTEALGGRHLALSENDPYYINFFDFTDLIESRDYIKFRERRSLMTRLMMIIANPKEEEDSKVTTIVADFIDVLHSDLGVLADNPNTWYRTAGCTPQVVYEHWMSYAGSDMTSKYGVLLEDLSGRFRTYMSAKGAYSHLFGIPLRVSDFLDSPVVRFDFGMLDSQRSYDETSFKLKLFFSDYITDVYVASNKEREDWTLIVNEEAQLVQAFTAAMYKKDATMRRSQNVVTVLLCNSVHSLLDQPDLTAVLGNTSLLAIGAVTAEDRQYLVRQYSLEKYEKTLISILEDSKMYRTFLFVNRLQANATTAQLQAYIPAEVADSELFTVVDTKDKEKKFTEA